MKKINDPGFGYSTQKDVQSIVNKNGSSNIIHQNKKISFQDGYAYLIQVSWLKFFIFIFISYVVLNLFFGLLYLAIGIEEIIVPTGSFIQDFLNGFFFSAQTITTVGYGGIAPHGLGANTLSAFEALVGLLGFSFITGLLYGRFSKPTASILFSKNIIIRNFKEGRALMFRLMNNRTSIMIEPEISVTLAVSKKNENNEFKREFFQLRLEFDKIKYLPTTWTIVHEIDSESPLYNLSENEIKNLEAEWYILMQYHEESFSQKVYKIHSYKPEDLKFNVQFVPSTYFNEKGYTVLNHAVLSEVIPMNN